MASSLPRFPLVIRDQVGYALEKLQAALRGILEALGAKAFKVEEDSVEVLIKPASGPGLSASEATSEACQRIDRIGDFILWHTAHPSELFPEYHREEIVQVQFIRGEPVESWQIRVSIHFEKTD
jgi:hypothetical protein